MLKRILAGLAAVAIVGLGCFAALAWQSPISPIAPPAKASFSPVLITRGEVLAGAGYCATCHTSEGRKALRRWLCDEHWFRDDLLDEYHARS